MGDRILNTSFLLLFFLFFFFFVVDVKESGQKKDNYSGEWYPRILGQDAPAIKRHNAPASEMITKLVQIHLANECHDSRRCINDSVPLLSRNVHKHSFSLSLPIWGKRDNEVRVKSGDNIAIRVVIVGCFSDDSSRGKFLSFEKIVNGEHVSGWMEGHSLKDGGP